ncbi:hypothetical protein GCM10028857_09750 [Salinarchaeum chitinilyticum]
MIHAEAPGVLAGAILLGAVHGVEPGHGWPVAAAYAMDRRNTWAAGFAASLIIGIGHLISSIAVVVAYFYAIAYFDLTGLDEPIVVAGVAIGGPLGVVAGLLLIGLGIREYYGGHGHGLDDAEVHDDTHEDAHDNAHDEGHDVEHAHEEGHDQDGHDHEEGHEHGVGDGREHEHGEHDDGHVAGHSLDEGHSHAPHEHDANHRHGATDGDGWRARLRSALPFVGGHEHMDTATAENRGLLGIAWVAFVLGFAHEEEFEIIALCTGSSHCLELMLAYAITVILGIVGLTMALVAGYQHFEERVERLTPYLPAFSAAVLIVMGLGFVLGIL